MAPPEKFTRQPRSTPSPYSLPGLIQVVRPILATAIDSWMWPCNPSMGWCFSIACLTDLLPAPCMTIWPALTIGVGGSVFQSSIGQVSRVESNGGSWEFKIQPALFGTLAVHFFVI